MDKKIPCTFVSVWDGGMEIESPALYEPETGVVCATQLSQPPDGATKCLERELIRFADQECDVRKGEDGKYVVICTYGVFFQLEGYAQVQASSPEEAMHIANDTLTFANVSWNEDWHATNAQRED